MPSIRYKIEGLLLHYILMKNIFFLLFLLYPLYISAQYVVVGGIGTPLPYSDGISGTDDIEKVYLLNTLNEATITYTTTSSLVTPYRYKISKNDKKEITENPPSLEGGVFTHVLSNLEDGWGYYFEENGIDKKPVWIIDYNQHQPALTSIEVIESEDKCKNIKLVVNKSDELFFYTGKGIRKDIPRKYTISYDNLVWSAENKKFEIKTVDIPEKEIGVETIINAPLMDTKFTLKGDQFAKHFFGKEKEISTLNKYEAIAVESHILTKQQKKNIADEVITIGEDLGGSAPVTIDFYGHGNEPTTGYYTWLLYHQKDANTPVARYTDKDINGYTFEESGNYTMKLEVADRTSICVDTTNISINISVSSLEIPNFFSPGTSPGINDEFRVAYKSLIKFKMTIFNRWGVKLFETKDPEKGWDGRYKGKYVNTGVYFYVIEAEGSEGKKYKEGGDINLFKPR